MISGPSGIASRARSLLVAGVVAVLASSALVFGTGAPASAASSISIGTTLDAGERLYSPNGDYSLTMHTEGNLILRQVSDGEIVWHPRAGGLGGTKVGISEYGNVVIWTASGKAVWASGTSRWKGGTRLKVTDYGHVVLFNNAGDVLWQVGRGKDIHGVERMIEYAAEQLGAPYVLGSHGPDYFDCSGLTYKAMQAGGFDIRGHKSADTQYANYADIAWDDRRRGDLLFFNYDTDAAVDHVAIYLGEGKMIHAVQPGTPLSITSVSYVSGPKSLIARPFA